MINKAAISLVMILLFGAVNAQNNQRSMDSAVKLLGERKTASGRDKGELGKLDRQVKRFGQLGEKKNVAAMNGIYREISSSLSREVRQAEQLLENDSRQVAESARQVKGSRVERNRSNARDTKRGAPVATRAAVDDRRDLRDDQRDKARNMQQRKRQVESTKQMRTIHNEISGKRFTSSSIMTYLDVKKKLDMFLQLMREQQAASEMDIRQLEEEVKELRMEMVEDRKNPRHKN